jgi:hypothetical protein
LVLLVAAFAGLQGIASHEPTPTVDVNKAAKADKAFINLLRTDHGHLILFRPLGAATSIESGASNAASDWAGSCVIIIKRPHEKAVR